MEQALALDPADLYTLHEAAMLFLGLGRPNSAIEVMEYVAARDPMDATNHGALGWLYMVAGRLDEAIASSRTSLKLSPDNIGTHYGIGVAMLRKGENKAALAAMLEEPEEGYRLTGLALAYHALGQGSASDAALAELIKEHEKSWSSTIAKVYAFRGETDRAFEWLNKAVAYHDAAVVQFPIDPFLSNLHNDPRWLPFLRKIGKTPEQLAAIKFDKSIAVLPFENRSREADDAFFVDGIHDDILTQLTEGRRAQGHRAHVRRAVPRHEAHHEGDRRDQLGVTKDPRRRRATGGRPRAHQCSAHRCPHRRASLGRVL